MWKARNAKVFEGVIPKVHEIIATIKSRFCGYVVGLDLKQFSGRIGLYFLCI